VRPDGKVDVTLAKIEKMRVDDLADRILAHLRENGGTMPLTDKSDPEDINRAFQCSKKDFKKALGLLYKQQKVTLGDTVSLT
jgi:predicted RNA-binding protein (virulence factor B family)